MIPKIKRYIKNNPKQVRIGAIVLLVLLVIVVLYKSLFYSSSEKAVYGVRTRDISEHKITNKDKSNWQDKVSDIDGITESKIVVKGRLIKFFITAEDNLSTDDIKAKCGDVAGVLSDKVKSYYDVTFYVKQKQDGKTKYPAIGYKHKTSDTITFDTF